jgi:hypothetical protein
MSNPTDIAAPVPPPPAPPRHRWLSVLVALLIFVAGGVCGAGLTVLVVVNRVQHAIRHPETAPARLAGVLQRRLDLTNEQRTQVEAIIAKRQTELIAIRREFQPRIAQQLEQLRGEISDVLTDEQRARWDDLFTAIVTRWLPPPAPAPPRPK